VSSAYTHKVAVTATAREFQGIYRGKKHHPPDFLSTLERAAKVGVEKVMLTGMSLQDVEPNSSLVASHPEQCTLTIGIHPYHAAIPESEIEATMNELAEQVEKALAQTPSSVSAFGELGLDYDRINHASKEDQIRVFKAQLDLFVAHEWQLPLFLHCRAAFEDFADIIKPYLAKLPKGGLVHSFVGSTDEMKNLLDLKLDISVNGFSLQDRESVDMVAAIPLERLQIETDAPWGEIKASSNLAKRYCIHAAPAPPSKKKDKWDAGSMVKERNESCNLHTVAFVVAGLKGCTVAEVANAAWRNSARMFGFGDVTLRRS
jgi:TatD DNase family protein